MNKLKFEKYRKALIKDLNNIKKFSQVEYGRSIGFLECNEIWLELNRKQSEICRGYIDETFLNSFTIFGRRKKLLKISSKEKDALGEENGQ